MNPKLLSICIPTFNRANILEQTLLKLFSNPDFDDNLIEVIVSDNCSTDNTSEIVRKFPKVLYYCNEVYVLGGYNFTIVMGYATSKYIKIFNDTFSFKENSLKLFLNKISLHEKDDKNLFFFPNIFINKNTKIEINTIDQLFQECSFYTTWSLVVGFWKKDFDKLNNKNRYSELHFPHLEWIYSTVKNFKSTIIYFEDLIDVTTPKNKGGYNIFKTFVIDYLEIVKNENLNFLTYEKEKYRLFRYFIFPWLLILFAKKVSDFKFEKNHSLKSIISKYWYEPYLYPFLIVFLFKNSIK